jgi:hypothetical protein
MIIGFTGPRGGPVPVQRVWLAGIFSVVSSATMPRPSVFHHGACIGSDAAAHWLAIGARIPIIVVHPPVNTKYMMDLDIPASSYICNGNIQYRAGDSLVIVLPDKAYHDRDRDIVDVSDRMLSTPAGPPTPRSGTWFTINYALSQHKPISLCYPDGEEDEL